MKATSFFSIYVDKDLKILDHMRLPIEDNLYISDSLNSLKNENPVITVLAFSISSFSSVSDSLNSIKSPLPYLSTREDNLQTKLYKLMESLLIPFLKGPFLATKNALISLQEALNNMGFPKRKTSVMRDNISFFHWTSLWPHHHPKILVIWSSMSDYIFTSSRNGREPGLHQHCIKKNLFVDFNRFVNI